MQPIVLDNISSLMHRLHLAKPLHPLVALVNYNETKPDVSGAGSLYLLHFYKIAFKSKFIGAGEIWAGFLRFSGRWHFLCSAKSVGRIICGFGRTRRLCPVFSSGSVVALSAGQKHSSVWFFLYSVSEALFLSEKEKEVIEALFQSIRTELENYIDQFSHDVLVSQIGLLLNHCNRFYNRQFITRNVLHHDLIGQMNLYLKDRFANQQRVIGRLPKTQEVAAHLKVSQRYLSDMLNSLTGKTTQEHIHLQLVEKAKELLTSDLPTTAETAYQLGFEHPQSFNKLFKQKTGLSPAAFRQGRLPDIRL